MIIEILLPAGKVEDNHTGLYISYLFGIVFEGLGPIEINQGSLCSCDNIVQTTSLKALKCEVPTGID